MLPLFEEKRRLMNGRCVIEKSKIFAIGESLLFGNRISVFGDRIALNWA
jgi:hypothetical protein